MDSKDHLLCYNVKYIFLSSFKPVYCHTVCTKLVEINVLTNHTGLLINVLFSNVADWSKGRRLNMKVSTYLLRTVQGITLLAPELNNYSASK